MELFFSLFFHLISLSFPFIRLLTFTFAVALTLAQWQSTSVSAILLFGIQKATSHSILCAQTLRVPYSILARVPVCGVASNSSGVVRVCVYVCVCAQYRMSECTHAVRIQPLF